jgi:hypothetical protein
MLAAISRLALYANDAINYPPQDHVVFCDGLGEKQGCVVNTKTGEKISCRPISNRGPTGGTFQPPDMAPLAR